MENKKHNHIKELGILVLALVIIGLMYFFGIRTASAPSDNKNIVKPSGNNSFNSTI